MLVGRKRGSVGPVKDITKKTIKITNGLMGIDGSRRGAQGVALFGHSVDNEASSNLDPEASHESPS